MLLLLVLLVVVLILIKFLLPLPPAGRARLMNSPSLIFSEENLGLPEGAKKQKTGFTENQISALDSGDGGGGGGGGAGGGGGGAPCF
jgi:hypothetical protein